MQVKKAIEALRIIASSCEQGGHVRKLKVTGCL